ncbi:MAG: hypothetical protein ACPG5B_10500 [Chitinophagales bacterium]
MKSILHTSILIIILVLLAGGGYFAYQKYIENEKIHIIENIEHEFYSTDEYVFSRDNMKFSEHKEYKSFIAHANYLYTWEASVPFGFKTQDVEIDYDKSSKTLKLTIKQLRLFPLTVKNQKKKKTSEFAYFNHGDLAAQFWEGIKKHTEKLVNKEFKSKTEQRNAIKEISRNSIQVKVTEILKKLDISDINVEADIQSMLLYHKVRV